MNLAIIEARWWKSGNYSVKGMFDVLWDILDQEQRFHYEMFIDRVSLGRVIGRIMYLHRQPHIRHLYIAGHGNDEGISGAEESNFITLRQLRNVVMAEIPARGQNRGGLYVSSCKFVNDNNTSYLFEHGISEKLR